MARRPRDTARSLAYRPDAPRGEALHAQQELQQEFAPKTRGSLLPSPDVERMIKALVAYQDDIDMRKASGAGAIVIPFPGMNDQRTGGPHSVTLDEFQVSVMGDYYEKPGTMQFDAMRQVVEQTPVLGAAIMTRVRQVERFCAPEEADNSPGFAIRHADPTHKLDGEDKSTIQAFTSFFKNCGWEDNARKRIRMKRDSFKQFMSKRIRDSLSLDSAPIETEMKRDRRRGIDGFYAIDGTTIRLCSERGYQGDDEIFALQVINGRIRTLYTHDDLVYQPRNPRADVRYGGYGLSEVELLVRIVTGWLNALTLNIKGFTDNAIPRGLLNLTGDFAQEDLDAFRRYWQGMVRGINNAWALPMLVSKNADDKATYQPIESGFNEMYFSKWMTFLTSVICALYCMSPEEINFESFTNGKSTLSGDDTEEKLAKSTDKGFRPLMAHEEQLFSDFILSEFGDKYVFRWTGLEEEDGEKKHELRKLLLTIDELRAEENYPPHPDPKIGAAPANPSLLTIYQESLNPQPGASDEGGNGQGDLDFGDGGGEDGGAGGGKGPPGAAAPAKPREPAGAGGFSKAILPASRVGW
jgi:hypothetical protein